MKGFNKDGIALFSNGEPLTALMDNVLASRIGSAMRAASKESAGDDIDRGLILLRLLNEKNIELREKQ